jgi:hypothetical protein
LLVLTAHSASRPRLQLAQLADVDLRRPVDLAHGMDAIGESITEEAANLAE